jgi:putative PIN family toxin of toxin-antitoxin system
MNAVLDVNVFVSAMMTPAGPPAEIIRRWLDKRFVLVVSPPIVDDLTEVVDRTTVRRFIRRSADDLRRFFRDVADNAHEVAPEHVEVVADDPDDDVILGTATAGAADFIVTGDDHLLRLRRYRGIVILTPRQFLAVLDEAEKRAGDTNR